MVSFPGQDRFKGEIYHSSQLTGKPVKDKTVLVRRSPTMICVERFKLTFCSYQRSIKLAIYKTLHAGIYIYQANYISAKSYGVVACISIIGDRLVTLTASGKPFPFSY